MAGLKTARARGRRGGRKFALTKAQVAARPGRDGAPRHVGVRAVPGARHQAGDALPVRRQGQRNCDARAKRRISPPPANNSRTPAGLTCTTNGGDTAERRSSMDPPTAAPEAGSAPPSSRSRRAWSAGARARSVPPRSDSPSPRRRMPRARSLASRIPSSWGRPVLGSGGTRRGCGDARWLPDSQPTPSPDQPHNLHGLGYGSLVLALYWDLLGVGVV